MSGYTCTIGQDDKPVVLLLTSLVSGDTTATCQDDLPIMMIGELAVYLGVDAQRLYDAVKRFADREAKSAAKAQAGAAETVQPSPAAVAARDAWVEGQGGEDAIKHRMTDPLLAGAGDKE